MVVHEAKAGPKRHQGNHAAISVASTSAALAPSAPSRRSAAQEGTKALSRPQGDLGRAGKPVLA